MSENVTREHEHEGEQHERHAPAQPDGLAPEQGASAHDHDHAAEGEASAHDHDHAADGEERAHVHDHAAEERAHKLSMQCWRAALRAQAADDWAHAVELGRQAIELVPEAPEPRFNLAVALAGQARATGDADLRAESARTFDAARGLVPSQGLVRYAQEAATLLEGKVGHLAGEPVIQYALGSHLALLGRAVRARRALQAASQDPTVGEQARAALAEVPEPQIARSAPVGRNDPCPCGSGKKYKKCHGAAA
jgi:hypothetical protein